MYCDDQLTWRIQIIFTTSYYAPPLIGGGIKRCFRVTSVCLSCTSGLSREQRGLGKTKIGTEVAHVTRDSDTTFKVKRSRSSGHFTQRGLNASGSCSGKHGNVLGMGNYCYVAVCLAALCALAHRGRTGAGAYHGVRPPTACYRLVTYFMNLDLNYSMCG